MSKRATHERTRWCEQCINRNNEMAYIDGNQSWKQGPYNSNRTGFSQQRTKRLPPAMHDHHHAPPCTTKRRGTSTNEWKRKDAHAFLNQVVYLWYCRFQRGVERQLQFIPETTLARRHNAQLLRCTSKSLEEPQGTHGIAPKRQAQQQLVAKGA